MVTPLSVSDGEAEALLAGADGGRDELADVAEVLAAIRTAGAADADKDFSHLIAPAVLESRTTPLSRFAGERAAAAGGDRLARAASRVAIGAAALFMLIIGTSGLAFAANGSKPGDWLYGLDRAAEVIGIGNGGAAERVAEAQALSAAGVPGGGLIHAAEVLATTPAAANAVSAAAVRLQQEPQGATEEIAAKVGDLLDYLHDATVAGAINDQTVSELAQQIGGPQGEGPPGQENDTTPPGNSENAPGHNKGEEGGPPGQAEERPPGHQNDTTQPGNSENAPGHNKGEGGDDDAPGNSENAPGQQKEKDGDEDGDYDDASGNSSNAPGQRKKP